MMFYGIEKYFKNQTWSETHKLLKLSDPQNNEHHTRPLSKCKNTLIRILLYMYTGTEYITE